MTLGELTSSNRRVALVGLAKNTGKTVALAALLRELKAAGQQVGVTSVGRDGEDHDVIDSRIDKPRVNLPAGSLVATTDGLLRASAVPHELLEEMDVRTPLGRVLIARLLGDGAIEVAGPSAAADVRAAADAMLVHGAEQVLIDGAIDRRAASSPAIVDGLVMSTGAVLSEDIDEVVLQTKDAVELVCLPRVDDASEIGQLLRELSAPVADDTSLLGAAPGSNLREASGNGRTSFLIGEDLEPTSLPPRFVLTSEADQIAEELDANPDARWLLVAGALPDRFLRSLLHPVHHRRRELVLVVSDPTRVFLWKRGPEWYRRQGVQLQALERVELEAITVNPVAPQSHGFDSGRLRGMLAEAIPEIPIFDVLAEDYPSVHQAASAV
ncbi:MAG TPA: hypothetical protein VIH71_07270 [Solirubrobacteraceae bacterium]